VRIELVKNKRYLTPVEESITKEAFLLIGGNEGDRRSCLDRAVTAIGERCGRLLAVSPLFETAAWGKEDQPSFLNQALCLATPLLPRDLLQTILQIEEDMGRVRSTRYGPRSIDIDILLYEELVVDEPGLSIPHPQLPFRRFALCCLAAIAPQRLHPIQQRTIAELLASCTDPLPVNKIS
jgi:2-amino-4-hydroxy-6-hydroxymethyldihydropteridine diphosphokinase